MAESTIVLDQRLALGHSSIIVAMQYTFLSYAWKQSILQFKSHKRHVLYRHAFFYGNTYRLNKLHMPTSLKSFFLTQYFFLYFRLETISVSSEDLCTKSIQV